MTDIKETIERLKGLAEKATARPWAVRPQEYDDWGLIRGPSIGEYRPIVARAAAGGYPTDEELSEHRRNKTDPYGPNAALITELVNAFPALITAFKELEVERDRLREALEAVVDLERAPEPEDDEYGFSSCNVEGFNTALSLAESIALKALEPKP